VKAFARWWRESELAWNCKLCGNKAVCYSFALR
jgi:hypothetical protein